MTTDTGNEVLIMLGTDLLTDLIIAASPSRRAKVTVESGDQKLEYVIHHSASSKTVPGRINGQDFEARMSQMPGATNFEGLTPGGPICETITYMNGSATAQGKAGLVDYTQSFALDPTSSYSGHYGVWSGTAGGKGFGVDMTVNPEGGYNLNGYIGDKGITGSIKNLNGNTLLLERNVGGTIIRETIEFGR